MVNFQDIIGFDGAFQAVLYTGVGVGGLWRLAYPAGNAAVVPWVAIVGAAVVPYELPAVVKFANAMLGLGLGVFAGELLSQNLLMSAGVGAAVGYMAFTNPVDATSATASA